MHNTSHILQQLPPLIRDLALILAVAGIVTLIFQKLRQPVVLGYIVAGTLVGQSLLPYAQIVDRPSIATWAQLGVIFLMFSLGLEFSFRKLARVGVSAALTAIIEVSVMNLLGFGAGRLLGWSTMECFFLGAMISISSTTILVRALDEMNLKTRRFAEMIFAILIVEDLIAILILVALSTFSSTQGSLASLASSASSGGASLLVAFGKLILVIGAWFATGYFLVPRFVKYVGRVGTNEMLTIVSVALCLGLVVFSGYFEYSVALGAFIMGSILAESTESFRIQERIEPLRDLFAAVFFVSVGMMIDPVTLWNYKGTILALTLLTVGGKVMGATLGGLLTGQTLRTAVQVGFGIAQIGEFSFIIAGLALTLNASEFIYPVAVAISVLTTFTTPYMIRVSHKFAVKLENRLPVGVRTVLVQYVNWVQERAADTATKKVFYRLLFKWALNGLLVTAMFFTIGALSGGIPTGASTYELGRGLGAWLLAMLVSSPFVWAMLNSFQTYHSTLPPGAVLLLMRFLTLIWIGFLSPRFLPLKYVFLLSATFTLMLFFFFRSHLERSYEWFEKRFLATFDTIQKTPAPRDLIRHLAPWDAHLVRLKVHPNSTFVLKTIAQANLRSRAGINVVVLQRGLKSIVAPKPDELILPKDELLVLGTDEQLESVRAAIEKPPGLANRFSATHQYEQTPVRVTDGSPLIGKSIRESGIRETFGAMVVGLERAEARLINPNSDMKIQLGDTLWLVGEKDELGKLSNWISTVS
ncbi:MAG: hypothetical protein A2070_13400 [Bdellovibrionales bacterium GWC1_52_8]|nr:MAG: hypothetical protein A2X97_14430 [Bdellovibrionales bacterium GWA1_52_35]OFZ38689.1 MAG: hypothetical protein A2070_13400 [Bdellovibrionales bacterium GWC1_52_8]